MNVLDDEGLDPTPPAVLVPSNRCDACGARAYLHAIVNGTELSYCGHHAAVYLAKLGAVASTIVDMRHTIPSRR